MNILLFLLFAVCTGTPDAGRDIHLIAHRGGVVDTRHGENTLSALQEAIRQGYWMVEVDVRKSKDGELVVLHDDNFMRGYGVRKAVSDLTWDEIRLLHSRKGGEPPCTFAEYAAQCRGRIGVMIDCKETDDSGGFFRRMETILVENNLLKDALFIGSAQMKACFKEKARIGTDRNGLKQAVEAGENVAGRYFLFEHGNELDDATVQYAESLNVPVIPTVNDYHYLLKRRNSTPQSDLERLHLAGVTTFQIDSAYAKFCK